MYDLLELEKTENEIKDKKVINNIKKQKNYH